MKALSNYQALLGRIDAHCRQVTAAFGEQVVCRAGCDGCCRHITIFPVEASALADALLSLPPSQLDRIRELVRSSRSDGPCPLLDDGLCLLYDARPIICRTHGLPLLTGKGEERTVDFCPLNFRDIATIPGQAIISLDTLNTILAAINALFMAELPAGIPREKERLTIAEALDLEPLL